MGLMGWLGDVLGGGKAPPPPDYAQAARDTAASSQEAQNYATWANRPDVYTPTGSQTWSMTTEIDPVTGNKVPKWQMNVALSPEEQAARSSQERIRSGLSGIAEGKLGQVEQSLGQGLDTSGLGAWGRASDPSMMNQQGFDTAYGLSKRELDPQWSQRTDEKRSQLYGMGLKEGDPAYDREMANLERQKAGAYSQAREQATLTGSQLGNQGFQQGMQSANYANALRQAQLAEQMGVRGQSLNELQSLLNGQQVGMPQGISSFQPGQAGAAQGADMLGAANMGFNAGMQGYNAQQQQLMGLLQGGVSMAGLPFGFA